MTEAAAIFVCHAHEDNAWCRTFVEALRRAGATVWYDEANLGSGVLGEEMDREMRARPIFIVILSPASVDEPRVRRQIEAAIGLRDENPERNLLLVVAEKTEIPPFWQVYTRVSGPGDTGVTAPEAAERVILLGIVPPRAPAAPGEAGGAETAAAANTRGTGWYAQKRYEEARERREVALAAYEHILGLDPENGAIWHKKGDVLGILKREEEALAAFDQAITLNPKAVLLAEALSGKGYALYLLKRAEEALAAFEQAITLNPQGGAGWTSKILVLKGLGRMTEAQEAKRQRAAALSPGQVMKFLAGLASHSDGL
ncbi:MAG: toll/interleukin-1 receptor domain-containing protein [Ktedonobacterales bacterium]